MQNEVDSQDNKNKFPITYGKLVNLMNHVDESFPKTEWGEFEVSRIDIFIQWNWQRRQNWMECLEEIADILATPILTNSQMYFISDDFRDKDKVIPSLAKPATV